MRQGERTGVTPVRRFAVTVVQDKPRPRFLLLSRFSGIGSDSDYAIGYASWEG